MGKQNGFAYRPELCAASGSAAGGVLASFFAAKGKQGAITVAELQHETGMTENEARLAIDAVSRAGLYQVKTEPDGIVVFERVGAKPKAKPRPAASAELTQKCIDIWNAAVGGVLNFGRMRRALSSLAGRYSDADVLRGWGCYVNSENPKYASPERFAERAGLYIGRPKSVQDEWARAEYERMTKTDVP